MVSQLDKAEIVLLQANSGKPAFNAFKIDVLRQLCEKHNLAVVNTGRTEKHKALKADYIRALHSYVSALSGEDLMPTLTNDRLSS